MERISEEDADLCWELAQELFHCLEDAYELKGREPDRATVVGTMCMFAERVAYAWVEQYGQRSPLSEESGQALVDGVTELFVRTVEPYGDKYE